jgi:hypothetical protein
MSESLITRIVSFCLRLLGRFQIRVNQSRAQNEQCYCLTETLITLLYLHDAIEITFFCLEPIQLLKQEIIYIRILYTEVGQFGISLCYQIILISKS